MATVIVNTSAMELSSSSLYDVVELTFNYAGTTVQSGTIIYYGAHLSDGTVEEDVLFSLDVLADTEIPASSSFAYTPGVAFDAEITATNGRVYYTP